MKLLVLGILLISLNGTFAQIATPPAAGDGSVGSPYQISNLENLYWISVNYNSLFGKYFIQTSDIDASETSTWFEGAGWAPIPNFNGTYNGQGYTISGLFINRPLENYVGLFARSYGGNFFDLGVTSANITGNISVGILFGELEFAYNTLENSYTSGIVNGTNYVGGLAGNMWDGGIKVQNSYSNASVTGVQFVGGFVGNLSVMAGTSEPGFRTVSQCYSIGTVNASGPYAGGFAGSINYYNGSIYQCYSTASVSGLHSVGGFSGRIEDLSSDSVSGIEDCYSFGNVNATHRGGGFVGEVFDIWGPTSILNSYSIGMVTGDSLFGGFVGKKAPNSIIGNCFWDIENSQNSTSAAGIGNTTAEMKSQITFQNADWDSTVWFMDSNFNNGYPYLYWQNPTGTPLPVELSQFYADISNDILILNWVTQNEINNFGFEIEIQNISEVNRWEKIGFVPGFGNSNSPREYSFRYIPNSTSQMEYRLKQLDSDGTFSYSNSLLVRVSRSPIKNGTINNYPNPFNPQTKVEFSLTEPSRIKLELYNIAGELISELVDKQFETGHHTYILSADQHSLATGVYILKFSINENSHFKKIAFIK